MKIKLNPVNLAEISDRCELYKRVALCLLPDFYRANRMVDWINETEAFTELLFERSKQWSLMSQAGLSTKKID